MAGSYRHVTEDDSSLSSNEMVVRMLENGGDVYEAIEEMYGMIWYLARMSATEITGTLNKEEDVAARLVEDARQNHKWGLELSPTKRYQNG